MSNDYQYEADPDHHAQSPERAVEEVPERVGRDAVKEAEVESWDLGDACWNVFIPVDLDECVAGDAEREQVDSHSSDDLIRPELDGEECVNQPHQGTRGHSDQDARDPRSRHVGAPDAPEGTHQHHPLDTDVHDPAALGEDPAERSEDERRSEDEHRCDQARPREDDLEIVDARPCREVGPGDPKGADDDRAPTGADRPLGSCIDPCGHAGSCEKCRHDQSAVMNRRKRDPERRDSEDDACDADALRCR